MRPTSSESCRKSFLERIKARISEMQVMLLWLEILAHLTFKHKMCYQ